MPPILSNAIFDEDMRLLKFPIWNGIVAVDEPESPLIRADKLAEEEGISRQSLAMSTQEAR